MVVLGGSWARTPLSRCCAQLSTTRCAAVVGWFPWRAGRGSGKPRWCPTSWAGCSANTWRWPSPRCNADAADSPDFAAAGPRSTATPMTRPAWLPARSAKRPEPCSGRCGPSTLTNWWPSPSPPRTRTGGTTHRPRCAAGAAGSRIAGCGRHHQAWIAGAVADGDRHRPRMNPPRRLQDRSELSLQRNRKAAGAARHRNRPRHRPGRGSALPVRPGVIGGRPSRMR